MAYKPSNPNEKSPNERLYNPYQELNNPIQALYKLPTSPEFLFLEESKKQRRSWGENLTYYTGVGYLSGSVSGASKGLFDGIKACENGDLIKIRALPISAEFLFSLKNRENSVVHGEKTYLFGSVAGAGKGLVDGIKACENIHSMKIRVNRVLNATSHTGGKFGNRVGVIGLMYSGLESGMVYLRDTDDVLNSVVAGLGTGMLYRAAAGLRSAAVAGAIGGVAVGIAVTAKQMLKRYVPI